MSVFVANITTECFNSRKLYKRLRIVESLARQTVVFGAYERWTRRWNVSFNEALDVTVDRSVLSPLTIGYEGVALIMNPLISYVAVHTFATPALQAIPILANSVTTMMIYASPRGKSEGLV